ncbi:hypothetical protein [Diaphorobacter aerolatus]|uniref:Uncharacterized protein n=1 Tax=Diaphorobacter aerolatus TaxID=1288495 RepID=A0A7H0GQW9_9BURK|nr:hypothetical protein [Diaphorobacter aerolatus]QNP50685.1 hypothetical protein H9K75_21595 [Diaphorobacter aerolatus]
MSPEICVFSREHSRSAQSLLAPLARSVSPEHRAHAAIDRQPLAGD